MYEQARRRQERWNGIKRWKMKEVLTYLPGLMHLALLLFTVGLCVYLWDTNVAVAIPFIVVTITASVIYLGTTVVSVFDKFCPYATPATPLLHIALHGFFSGVASLLGKKSSPEWLAAITEKTSGGVETENSKSGSHYVADKQVPMDGVTGQMLEWIVTNCEDSRSVDIAVEAFAGASTVSIDRLLVGSKLIRSLPGRVSQFLEKCHIGKDNAYVLNDQRRLALVMLYSRINNLLIYKGIYVNMADVSMTEETIRRDVFRYHYELSDKVNQMLFRDTESINNLSALALVVATSVPSWVYIKSIQAKVHHRGLAFSLLECILGDRRTLSLPVDWPEKMASLLQEHLSSGGPRLSSNALHALVESSIHYLVGLYPWQSAKDRRILVPLSLAQLYFALPLSSAAIPTIAVALAATEFATYPHTGGEEPPNAMGSRRRRALEVIKHYRKDSPDDKSTHDLFHFGFVGFLSELTSDGWTQHADTIQDLLKSLKARFPTPIDSSIYTLPDLNPNSREVLAVRRCLSSLSRSTFTQDAEKAMTTSCLEHILSDRIRGGSSDLKLYSAALVALRYAQSIELQTLCRRVILCQRTPLISDCLPQVVSEQLVLSHLQYVSTSNLSHIGPVAIIHTAVLVAAILLSAYSPFTARRAALETMIEQESSLDQQPVDIANYSSRLSQAIDQTSGPEALRHILQCAAEFYHATAVQRADMDAQIIADGDLFHWNTKLQRFNEQLYRPTGRT